MIYFTKEYVVIVIVSSQYKAMQIVYVVKPFRCNSKDS